jgi:hypothetical protein
MRAVRLVKQNLLREKFVDEKRGCAAGDRPRNVSYGRKT